jgi:hypothetical protein
MGPRLLYNPYAVAGERDFGPIANAAKCRPRKLGDVARSSRATGGNVNQSNQDVDFKPSIAVFSQAGALRALGHDFTSQSGQIPRVTSQGEWLTGFDLGGLKFCLAAIPLS